VPRSQCARQQLLLRNARCIVPCPCPNRGDLTGSQEDPMATDLRHASQSGEVEHVTATMAACRPRLRGVRDERLWDIVAFARLTNT